jgi:hypothetical protein
VLFRGSYVRNDDSHFFDVTADGRFLALRYDRPEVNARAEEDDSQPVLVQGWSTEVRRLLAR